VKFVKILCREENLLYGSFSGGGVQWVRGSEGEEFRGEGFGCIGPIEHGREVVV